MLKAIKYQNKNSKSQKNTSIYLTVYLPFTNHLKKMFTFLCHKTVKYDMYICNVIR